MQVIDLHLYLKCHSSIVAFKHFASKNQLPGFFIKGTWVENGLIFTGFVKPNISHPQLCISYKEELI